MAGPIEWNVRYESEKRALARNLYREIVTGPVVLSDFCLFSVVRIKTRSVIFFLNSEQSGES
jgi:hypothetical protein